MKIFRANVQLIEYLKDFLSMEWEQQKLFCVSSTDFTRERKLGFCAIVLMITSLCKRSLAIELESYFGLTRAKPPSLSAFSQQRLKLKWQFFMAWNDFLVKTYYILFEDKVKRWQGFRVIAADGSTAYLLNKPKIINYFGVQANQSVDKSMARIMNYFDVLNKVSVFSIIEPITHSEQSIAIRFLEKVEDDMLVIYDRGYPGFVFYYMNSMGQEKEKKFVVRCNISRSNSVKEFIKSGKKSHITEISASTKNIEQLHKLGYKMDGTCTIKIRYVRVKLKTGEIEVLATNLMDEKTYPGDIFRTLYFKRWAVETEYSAWKNLYQIEQFSGHSPEVIKQDFYATVFIANLHQVLMKEAKKDIKEKCQNRKHEYQTNRNVTFGLMKPLIVELFLEEDPVIILKYLKNRFCRYLQPCRPDRSYPRQAKNKRAKGKYQTLTNYKRAA